MSKSPESLGPKLSPLKGAWPLALCKDLRQGSLEPGAGWQKWASVTCTQPRDVGSELGDGSGLTQLLAHMEGCILTDKGLIEIFFVARGIMAHPPRWGRRASCGRRMFYEASQGSALEQHEERGRADAENRDPALLSSRFLEGLQETPTPNFELNSSHITSLHFAIILCRRPGAPWVRYGPLAAFPRPMAGTWRSAGTGAVDQIPEHGSCGRLYVT